MSSVRDRKSKAGTLAAISAKANSAKANSAKANSAKAAKASSAKANKVNGNKVNGIKGNGNKVKAKTAKASSAKASSAKATSAKANKPTAGKAKAAKREPLKSSKAKSAKPVQAPRLIKQKKSASARTAVTPPTQKSARNKQIASGSGRNGSAATPIEVALKLEIRNDAIIIQRSDVSEAKPFGTKTGGNSANGVGPVTLRNGSIEHTAAKPGALNGASNGGAKIKQRTDIVLPQGYRPQESEPFMNERQRQYFRNKLLAWKDDILKQNMETLKGLHDESAQQADPADRATAETDRALELRARDRQRKLMGKIASALARIDEGSYGYCEETGEPISLKRLDARPIATLSIEAQERRERRERVFRDE